MDKEWVHFNVEIKKKKFIQKFPVLTKFVYYWDEDTVMFWLLKDILDDISYLSSGVLSKRSSKISTPVLEGDNWNHLCH